MNKKITKHLILTVLLSIWSCSSAFSATTLVRMLAIGNSFSEDALEAYVADLAKADGVQVIVGNLYWGGCDLVTHWNNANTNNSGYSYRKIVVDANGSLTKTTRESTSIQYAVQDENWDYITFQQVSQHSGKYSTFFPYLTDLKQYVNNFKTNPNVKYALHRTWAYASNSTHSEYDYYHSNQLEMYDSITNAYAKAAVRSGIEMIIPTGTAIQNARTSYLGDNLNRDGYHLSLGLGRYIAACAWYEKMVGRAIIGNTYRPTGVTAYEANVAQNAAHYAVTNPGSITSMSSYTAPPTIAPAPLTSSVNIDFGDKAITLAGWNNMTSVALNSTVSSLVDATGTPTALSIKVNDAFNGVNQSGPAATTTSLSLPGDASVDCFYGNGAGLWGGIAEPTGGFLVAGLYPGQQYDFCFFGSRMSVSDNRETYYTVSGDKTETVYLNASNNTTNVVSVTQVKAKGDGTISIAMGAGPNNNQTNKFFYINALVIKPTVSTGVQQTKTSGFRFYPNPVKDFASIEANENINDVAVYNITGKKVFALSALKTSKVNVDLTALSDGYYVIKCDSERACFIKR